MQGKKKKNRWIVETLQEMLGLALVMSGGAPGDVAAALKDAFLRYSSAQPGPGEPSGEALGEPRGYVARLLLCSQTMGCKRPS